MWRALHIREERAPHWAPPLRTPRSALHRTDPSTDSPTNVSTDVSTYFSTDVSTDDHLCSLASQETRVGLPYR